MKQVHFDRLNILINYIEQKATEEGLLLKRRDILEIIGISEGDSAKAIFRILNNMPESYSNKIIYEKRDKQYYFNIAGERTTSNNVSFTLENVIQAGNINKYITILSGQQLVDLWKQQFVTYNPCIQRGLKTEIDKDGNVIEKHICSEKNIKEIAEKIISGNYFTDTIILNISDCGIVFDRFKWSFTIEKTSRDSECNVLDGQHRLKGLLLAEELIKERKLTFNLSELYFPIQIECLNIPSAQNAFSQFAKGLKISTTRTEYFNNIDEHNVFLKDVIEKSVFDGKVETVKDNTKNTDKLVSFGTLINAFKENFSIEELNDDLKDYMIKFFNKLYETLPKEKSNDMKHENITYYGYLGVAKEIYNKDKDVSILSKIISSTDFNKESKLWCGTVLLQGKKGLNITNKKDTRSYVKNLFISQFRKVS